jgi:ABC-type transporter Mla subunit MlaD
MIDTRDHIRDGITVGRLRLESRRAVRPMLIVLIGVLATLAGGAYLFSHVSNTLFRSTYEVKFAIRDATSIVPGVQDVRYRGIIAGNIVEVQRDGRKLYLVAKIRKEYGPIYKDARATLRPDTPLQDIYLDIVDPGTKAAGKLGGDDALPETRTDQSVNVDDVLNTLQADQRVRLRQLLANLGNGLDDRGAALRAVFVQLAPLLKGAGDISAGLAHRERSTRRLVHDVATLTGDLGERDVMLRNLLKEGNRTFTTLQAGRGDLDQTLRELPPTFTEIGSSLAAVRGVLGNVDRAVDSLNPAAEKLPASLEAIDRLSDTLTPAARKLQSPVEKLVPLSRALRPVSAQLRATVSALDPQVPALDHATTTLVRCEKGFIGFFQWNTSLTKFGDLRGTVPRGNLTLGVPDTGVGATRTPARSCAQGAPAIGGRPALPQDGH